jgi:hypothetical protein
MYRAHPKCMDEFQEGTLHTKRNNRVPVKMCSEINNTDNQLEATITVY